MKNLKIKVTGKVQGVWFRANTKKKADQLHLHGFVQNENDGSVYIEVSGEDGAIKKFLQWVRQGPELANVKKVMVSENDNFYNNGFEIRR